MRGSDPARAPHAPRSLWRRWIAALRPREILVFVSSPSDCAAERVAAREAVAALNDDRGVIRQGLRFRALLWEDLPAVVAPDLDFQSRIDDMLRRFGYDAYGIYLGIMKGRLGSPTARHPSGTIEELELSLARRARTGAPADILFYFITPDAEASAEVHAYAGTLRGRGVLPTMVTATEFPDRLRRNLLEIAGAWTGWRATLRRTWRPVAKTATGVALAATLGLGIVETMWIHAHLAADGSVVIRPGFAATHAIAPVHLVAPLDTGLSREDLRPEPDAAAARIGSSTLRGWSWTRDEDGLRSWASLLEPAISEATSRRWRTLVRGAVPTAREFETAPPLIEASFLAALRRETPDAIARRIAAPPPADTPPCTASARAWMDFTLLELPSDVLRLDLRWHLWSLPETVAAAKTIAGLVRLVAYRALHARDEEARETDDRILIDELARFAADREMQARHATATTRILEEMTATWCQSHADLALALIGDGVARPGAEARLASAVAQSSSVAPGERAAATAALSAVAALRPLSADTLVKLETALDQERESLVTDTAANRVLASVVLQQELPASLRARLFQDLRAPSDSNDFEPVAALRLLARNARFMAPSERQPLRAWIENHGAAHRTMSDFHEAIGFLGTIDAPGPSDVAWLVDRLARTPVPPPPTRSRRGEIVIVADDLAATLALARIGQKRPLSEPVVQHLVDYALVRPDLTERVEILRALAMQWRIAPDATAEDVVTAIRAHRSSAAHRRLETELRADAIRASGARARNTAIDRLVPAWKANTEPEERVALAILIGLVALRP